MPPDPQYGAEDASTSDLVTPPSSNLSGNLSTSIDLIGVSWQAHLRYTYSLPDYIITEIRGFQPFPVPVSQPVTDDNGKPAVLYNSVGTWSFTTMPINQSSWYAHWDLIGIYNYVFTTGPFPVLKNEYIAKLVTVP